MRYFTKKSLSAVFLSISVIILSSTTVLADTTNNDQIDNTTFNDAQVKQIQTIMKNYLMKNPEILITVSQELQKKQQAEQQQAAMAAIIKNKTQLFNDPNSPVIGSPKGKYTLVEFYDYQCGHCKTMNSTLHSLLQKDPSIKLILKELPIFGGVSQYAAQASLAVYKIAPTQYQAFHEALLKNDGALTEETVIQNANDLGIATKKLKTIMDSQDVKDELAANFQLAQDLGIKGTPGFVVANSDLSLNRFAFIPGAVSGESLTKTMQTLGNENQSAE